MELWGQTRIVPDYGRIGGKGLGVRGLCIRNKSGMKGRRPSRGPKGDII